MRLLGLMRQRTREKHRSERLESARYGFAARVHAELSEELPDEDLGEDLADTLDDYERDRGPDSGECEGADGDECEELLERVREAVDRIERGR
ncbi:hypothetical protein [Streptomyces sp. NPDC101393]|uniref:hypothetical protein n=1 Tax=Streptomyces sp. NPDC101393 TaxID=3366141 RepID=UPI0038029C7B